MVIARYFAMLAALTLFAAPGHAQDGGIKIEKFTHSEWTRGIFSEAVTVTGIGNAKFVYLAGVGAEDENGPRGNVRHHGNFLEQCRYAYDKVKRVLAHHGASLRDAVKVTTYITDLRHRLTLGQCVKDTWGDVVFPTNTLIGVGALAFPEMIIEVDVTAIVTAKQLGWLELAKAVRKRYPAMPVLLCTGYRSSAQDAVRQGFVVLHKPFDLAALEQGLREAHSRKLGQTDAA